jgi:hypothetical protein
MLIFKCYGDTSLKLQMILRKHIVLEALWITINSSYTLFMNINNVAPAKLFSIFLFESPEPSKPSNA